MFRVSSSSCLCPIHWFSREWRYSWSSGDRRCANYIWVINKYIAYYGAVYITGLTVGCGDSEWLYLPAAVVAEVEAVRNNRKCFQISIENSTWHYNNMKIYPWLAGPAQCTWPDTGHQYDFWYPSAQKNRELLWCQLCRHRQCKRFWNLKLNHVIQYDAFWKSRLKNDSDTHWERNRSVRWWYHWNRRSDCRDMWWRCSQRLRPGRGTPSQTLLCNAEITNKFALNIMLQLIDLLHKPHNAPVIFHSMHNSVTEMSTCFRLMKPFTSMRQVIIWIIAGLVLIALLGTNFSEIWMKIQQYS